MLPFFLCTLIGALAFKNQKFWTPLMATAGLGVSMLIGLCLPTTKTTVGEMPITKVWKTWSGGTAYYTYWQEDANKWKQEGYVAMNGVPVRTNDKLQGDEIKLVLMNEHFAHPESWVVAAEWPLGYSSCGIECSTEKLAYFMEGMSPSTPSTPSTPAVALASNDKK